MNKQIFESIVQLKREWNPNERLILFGSQARGDARPDSDWDLIVLLNKENVILLRTPINMPIRYVEHDKIEIL
jgi:predicted nucleotidyltransferase